VRINRFGLRLVTLLGVVAMKAKDVRDAERRGAQQIALQRHSIAVAHRELQHRLDAVLRQDCSGGQRRHMRPRPGTVGDVDRVGQPLQAASAVEDWTSGAGIGRRSLRGQHEVPGAQCRLEAPGRPVHADDAHDIFSCRPPAVTSRSSRSSG
jgi:hypothetical protein